MELEKPKIAMYAKRSFGEKLNATFDFIKENWKPLFKYITYLILPLCLIQALSLNGLMSGSLSMSMNAQAGALSPLAGAGLMFWMNYGLMILCSLLGSMILVALLYSLMATYNNRDGRLEGITFTDIRPLLFKNMGKLLLVGVFCVVVIFIICFIIGSFMFLTPFTLILTVPLALAGSVPLALFAPIYLFENIGVMAAFKKTFRLGFATWGGIFLLTIIMNLIAGILQSITMLPWYIATIVKYFFAVSDGGTAATVSPLYSFFLYLLGILQGFGAYLSMAFVYISLAYQYGHASEVVDSVSVEDDIDNFDKL